MFGCLVLSSGDERPLAVMRLLNDVFAGDVLIALGPATASSVVTSLLIVSVAALPPA